MTEQIKNNIEDLVNKSRQAQELLNDIDERKINIFLDSILKTVLTKLLIDLIIYKIIIFMVLRAVHFL